tara:strand:- start:7359 stop:9371 length:2013 start_codon:yes stop_codon:yes gene_type:complete
MSFLSSPGVHVREIDLTNVVPSVATTVGAIAGPFERGPVSSITTIGSEEELVQIFGKPQGDNFEWWFTAANFLAYSDQLKVVRCESAVVNAGANSGILIRDDDHYLGSFSTGQGSHGEWAARTAGTWGNSIGVSLCPSASAYEQHLGTNNRVNGAASAGATSITVDDADASGYAFQVGDLISFSSADSSSDVTAFAHISGDEGNEYEVTAISTNALTIRLKDDVNGAGLKATIADDSYIRRRWRFYDLFDSAPGTSQWATDNGRGSGDELHVVVYDATGDITGYDNDVAGQRTSSVIERYGNMSKNPVAKTAQGGSNYYPDVLFRQSSFIYWTDHISAGSNWGTDVTAAYTNVVPVDSGTLTGGTDDYAVTNGELKTAYDEFADTESLDINLVLAGPSSGVADTAAAMDTHGTMITDLVETRKDCVGFISPYRAATVNVSSSVTQTANVINAFDLLPSSSYIVYDSGYKYMYDKYNDVYRYCPLNGDIAGLCANADKVADPWFSPAGLNRGHIRGAIKLSYNPKNSERDQLYRARINPVTNFPGQGVLLFGDKTALTKPSAFDRINVRRLFLVLEKAISIASKYQLFEFNDEFTRAQFRNMVEPFLRDVQGRRGIFDFKVVCDASNNTGEVIDRNEFIGDIYIKPARSINFITLNFIATRTGVAFSEVGG